MSSSRKKDLHDIAVLAKTLPVMYSTEKETVVLTGRTVLAQGTKKINGEKVHPDDVYMGEQNKRLDHRKNMVELYKKHGTKGVQAYLTNIDEVLKKREDAAAQATAN